MTEFITPGPGDLILCERRDFQEAISIGGLIFGVITLGLGFVLLYLIYGLVPRQIWVRDGRVFADKILPPGGVPVSSAKVTIRTVSLPTSVEIARTIDVELFEAGKRFILAINGTYFSQDQVEAAVDFFANPGEV